MIELPNKKKCYNLPEQVAQNLLNIQYLAEQYKNIDALPAIWQTYKEEFDNELETFGEWTTTFEGWTESLSTYLANMSSAAVGAIAGQTIAPAVVNAVTSISAPAINGDAVTGDSIIENMIYGSYLGYMFNKSVDDATISREYVYASIVKNGNKLTGVIALNVTRLGTIVGDKGLGTFVVPVAVGDNLYPTNIGGTDFLGIQKIPAIIDQGTISDVNAYILKRYSNNIELDMTAASLNNLTLNQKYYVRIEFTFLLSQNLAE